MLLLLFFYFSLYTQNIPVFRFPSYQACGVPFWGANSPIPDFPEISRLAPFNVKYVVPGNTYGIAGQPLALLYNRIYTIVHQVYRSKQ